jgi:hypothetical protein
MDLDSDPGGPKTYGSDGSGILVATLAVAQSDALTTWPDLADHLDADPNLLHGLRDRVSDPDPYSESGFRRTKMTTKVEKINKFHVLKSAGCSLLRAEGFICNLDVLYGGLGIGKL